MKGRLQERPLATLCRDLQVRTSSGVLTLEKGAVKKQLCFVKGILRFAASNLREDRLGEFLLRTGAVPADLIRRAEQEIASGHKMGEILVAWGTISPEQARDLVHAQLLEVVLPCFDWKDGQYRFQDGVPNIVGEVMSEVTVLELAVERARRSLTPALVEKVLLDRSLTPILALPNDRELVKIKLTPAESFLLAQAGSGASLKKILGLLPAGGAELARAAAVFVTSGILALSKPPAASESSIYDTLPPGMKAPAQRVAESSAVSSEVQYYKQMYTLLLGADLYTTLGVDPGATSDDIQRAYYGRAKEIHPDRFLAPPLDILHRDMEELFSQVLEAYRTLVDPAARTRYDTERLTGGQAPKQAEADQQAIGRGNFLRGRALFEEGKLADAHTYLQNAVDADPNRPEYLRLLAAVQARNPRMRREAEQSFLRAIELDPARADTYLQLGVLYRKLGENDKAVQTLQECLKWDPANLEAGTVLAEITGTVGDRK